MQNKIPRLLIFYILLVLLQACDTEKNFSKAGTAVNQEKPTPAHPLVTAYPGYIDSVSSDSIYWTDGEVTVFRRGGSDTTGISKMTSSEFEKFIDRGDAFLSLLLRYPALETLSAPGKNEDPGRIRDYDLLKKVYGSNPAGVEKNLTEVIWLPKKVNIRLRVNKNNGSAESLRKISAELDSLPDKYLRYLNNPAGTYKWREIAGSDRLSAHSFGIAIDINVNYSHYWRWDRDNSEGMVNYKNSIPEEIVHIFEKHGWIWGGRWYHYDTMHFEYRPELINIHDAEESSSERGK